MVQRFSIMFERTNQNISGVAYRTLSPFLSPANMTLTKLLTLPHQEGFRGMKSKDWVILFTLPKRLVSRLNSRCLHEQQNRFWPHH